MHLWHLPDAAWFQRKVPLTPKIKKKNRTESGYKMQYSMICERTQPNFNYPILQCKDTPRFQKQII